MKHGCNIQPPSFDVYQYPTFIGLLKQADANHSKATICQENQSSIPYGCSACRSCCLFLRGETFLLCLLNIWSSPRTTPRTTDKMMFPLSLSPLTHEKCDQESRNGAHQMNFHFNFHIQDAYTTLQQCLQTQWFGTTYPFACFCWSGKQNPCDKYLIYRDGLYLNAERKVLCAKGAQKQYIYLSITTKWHTFWCGGWPSEGMGRGGGMWNGEVILHLPGLTGGQ